MPGIVGLITKIQRELAEQQLRTMLGTLRHEPFYVTGTWCDESMGVYVGWAARGDSFSDGMPLSSERGDVVLVFSGEEFPEPGMAGRLKARGHKFAPDGPSYLVHVYEDDPAFPAGLNGRFQGLIADRSCGRAMLFNDRYGLERIYCHESKEAFYFAAEAKAILAVRPELRRLDLRGMGEFLACGCVLDNRTIFHGIRVLPAGSAWLFRNGAVEAKRAYFDQRQWEEQEPLEPETWYRQMREVFTQNLPRYFNGHERIAMSLTGGLDSRMILAWHKPPAGSLPCYTFGGAYRDCRDVVVARQVASACQQPHQVITVGREFLSRFPRYAERAVYLSDGCVEVNRAPDLFANEKAREVAPVRMTGNYGSEILRANRAFKPVEPLAGLFTSEVLSQVHAAGENYREVIAAHPVSFAAFRQVPWYHYGLLALEQTQLSLRSPYLDNDFVGIVFRAPKSALASSDACLQLIADGDMTLWKIRTDRGLAGNHGLLGRAVTHRYLEFTFKAEYAYDYGMPQWLARVDHVLSPLHLERLFLGRHKFYHFRVWYRDQLSKYIQEMLLDSRTLSRPYLRRKTLEAVVESHLRGDHNYTTEIHKVLTLELTHRLFL